MPPPSKLKLPEEPSMELSLFAIQTTVWGDTENQMPRYFFVEPPGEKNPRTNRWLGETRVSPSLRDSFGPIVSLPLAGDRRTKRARRGK